MLSGNMLFTLCTKRSSSTRSAGASKCTKYAEACTPVSVLPQPTDEQLRLVQGECAAPVPPRPARWAPPTAAASPGRRTVVGEFQEVAGHDLHAAMGCNRTCRCPEPQKYRALIAATTAADQARRRSSPHAPHRTYSAIPTAGWTRACRSTSPACDEIWHAGDIGGNAVSDELQRFLEAVARGLWQHR